MDPSELLLIPDKADVELTRVSEAWIARGGNVQRVGRFWEYPRIGERVRVTIYGPEMFALVLAQVLGKRLMTVDEGLIASLDKKWVKRRIRILRSEAVARESFPLFVKSLVPKTLEARVYLQPDDFLKAIDSVLERESVIVSDPVEIACEFRLFVLCQSICDIACYQGTGNPDNAREFSQEFLNECGHLLPTSFVMDVGFSRQSGWMIIEFNSSWGAGLNSCNPTKVLECIREATVDE